MEEEQKLKVFSDVCDYFNIHNVMTQEDFNDICDFYTYKGDEEEVIE